MAHPMHFISVVFILLFLSNHGLSFTIHSESVKPLTGFDTMPSKLQPIRVVKSKALRPLGATAAPTEVVERERRVLDAKQLDFVLGYMNKHHGDLLVKIAETFSEVGAEKKRKNALMMNSYQIVSAKIVAIDTKSFELEVEINQRKKSFSKTVEVDLDAAPVIKIRKAPMNSLNRRDNIPLLIANDLDLLPIDDIIRRLCRMCWMANEPAATGKLFQLGIQLGGSDIGKIKDNMYLNQVPHNRYVRKYFYEMASDAVLEAVIQCSKGRISNRMKVTAMFPEMNPSMDSYRYAFLLQCYMNF